jgi:hypothetical protein
MTYTFKDFVSAMQPLNPDLFQLSKVKADLKRLMVEGIDFEFITTRNDVQTLLVTYGITQTIGNTSVAEMLWSNFCAKRRRAGRDK